METRADTSTPKINRANDLSQIKRSSSVLSLPQVPALQLIKDEGNIEPPITSLTEQPGLNKDKAPIRTTTAFQFKTKEGGNDRQITQASMVRPFVHQNENKAGMPANKETGVENFSAFSVKDRKADNNLERPLNAFAQVQPPGVDIVSVQEKHLPFSQKDVVQRWKKDVHIPGKNKEKIKAASEDPVQRYIKPLNKPAVLPHTLYTPINKPIQLFSEESFAIDEEPVTGILSETGKFFMPGGPIQTSYIYAIYAPDNCKRVNTKKYHFNNMIYGLYVPAQKFLDDCLHTAEEILNRKNLAYAKDTYSRETTTNRVFGQSDKRNIEIAERAAKDSLGSVNGSADAGIGNAFVIIDTEFNSSPSKRSPYHAAGVIGVDGSDRVTMEVFASNGSLTQRKTDSLLSMYTVGGGEASFHGYWSANYFSDYKTITIVIKGK